MSVALSSARRKQLIVLDDLPQFDERRLVVTEVDLQPDAIRMLDDGSSPLRCGRQTT